MSSTSSSRTSSTEPHVPHASGVEVRTVTWPSGQYQTGIWCPHQSCREMHQGRICSIQWKNVPAWDSGWKRTRPLRTASIAGAASSCISQNHWSEISGSMRSPLRSQWPTSCS